MLSSYTRFFTLIFLFLFGAYLWSSFNKLVKREESAKVAWSQVENQYQRRADLIANLVETVKGYAEHEQEAYTGVIEARAKAMQLKTDIANMSDEQLQQFSAVQAELAQAAFRLVAVVENYPELKANDNFIMLQGQLEGAENRIAIARRDFNEAANRYNAYRRRFPKNIPAAIFGFKAIKYFESIPDADKPTEVEF